jgi:hypothetical protein
MQLAIFPPLPPFLYRSEVCERGIRTESPCQASAGFTSCCPVHREFPTDSAP